MVAVWPMNGAMETYETFSPPVEPDLMQKHTLYAVAWGIIQLPPRDDEPRNYQERVRIKRACRAYAMARGWMLALTHDEAPNSEQWMLTHHDATHVPHVSRAKFGTLQECCLHIVEHDIWPEGKPEDDSPTG